MLQPIIKEIKHSPRPHIGMDFPTAMKSVIEGKTITKLEWANRNIFGILKDGFLMLHKEDGKHYQWVISEGDLTGKDYIVLSDALKVN